MKVLLFDFRDSERKFFHNNKFCDFDIKFFDESLSEKTKLSGEEFEYTDVLCVYRSSILSSSVLSKFKNLRIIATRSFGFSHIDLEYCRKNNIAVLNVNQYGDDAIAQYVFGLIIDLTRKIRPALLDIKNNNVNPKKYEGKLLRNFTIGIIGCGNIGVKIAQIADFFGMNVLISSYKQAPKLDISCKIVPFETLLEESDIISLHMPFTTETYQILGKNEFEKMKNGVYIINTSSVELIDLDALYEGLTAGKIAGAGLDILESDYKNYRFLGHETMSSKYNSKITSKLLEMPNAIITPHIAYNTSEYIDYVLETTINNIRDFTKGLYTNRVF